MLDDFIAARPRLLSVAHRMLGSVHDAEDAVQTAWLHIQAAPTGDIDNTPAWLMTVVTRVCLDQLRGRHRRDALTRRDVAGPDTELAADEAILIREDVSRALMVLLDRLTPPQRVAFVLHDLFGVPFDQVAVILDTTPASAKKHASRARTRVRPVHSATADTADTEHRAVVSAFLQAAAGGDIASMIALMAPDCTRVADRSLLAPGAPARVVGARAVAEETRGFVDRIRSSTPMHVNGRAADVIAPGGHAMATVDVTTRGGRVTHIVIAPVRADDRLTAVPASG